MSAKNISRSHIGSRRRDGGVQDEYGQIYALIRRRAFDAALGSMVQASTGRLTKDFSKDPNHSWYVIGDVLYKKGEYSRALSAFKKALKAWTEDSEAMWAIADCFGELSRYKSAERYYRLANRAKPDKRVLFNLGNALFDQEKFRSALRIYRSIRPDDKALAASIRRNVELAESKLDDKAR